jgi:hypothetical protein
MWTSILVKKSSQYCPNITQNGALPKRIIDRKITGQNWEIKSSQKSTYVELVWANFGRLNGEISLNLVTRPLYITISCDIKKLSLLVRLVTTNKISQFKTIWMEAAH